MKNFFYFLKSTIFGLIQFEYLIYPFEHHSTIDISIFIQQNTSNTLIYFVFIFRHQFFHILFQLVITRLEN
jgi:hypothetical protein